MAANGVSDLTSIQIILGMAVRHLLELPGYLVSQTEDTHLRPHVSQGDILPPASYLSAPYNRIRNDGVPDR